MGRMPNMTREGRRKRQLAWQQGQYMAEALMEEVREEALAYDTDERVEFLRGVGQWFGSKAHELATEGE